MGRSTQFIGLNQLAVGAVSLLQKVNDPLHFTTGMFGEQNPIGDVVGLFQRHHLQRSGSSGTLVLRANDLYLSELQAKGGESLDSRD